MIWTTKSNEIILNVLRYHTVDRRKRSSWTMWLKCTKISVHTRTFLLKAFQANIRIHECLDCTDRLFALRSERIIDNVAKMKILVTFDRQNTTRHFASCSKLTERNCALSLPYSRNIWSITLTNLVLAYNLLMSINSIIYSTLLEYICTLIIPCECKM